MSPALPLARVVVLAGGGSRRLGHDKLAAALGSGTVLDALLTGLAAAAPGVPVTAVGPPRTTALPVTWVREEPAGGGPVAGLVAGLAGLDDTAVVAVLAGDAPFAAPALGPLAAALRDTDAAVGTDPDGHDQPLLALYRVGPLRRAVGPRAAGSSVRSVLGRLTAVRVPLAPLWCLDVDTADDLAAVRAAAQRQR